MATLSQQCCPVPSSDSILYMFMYCLPRYCDIDVLVLAVKPMVNSKGVTESPAMIQIDTRYSIHYSSWLELHALRLLMKGPFKG